MSACAHPLDQCRDTNAMLVCGVCHTYLGRGDTQPSFSKEDWFPRATHINAQAIVRNNPEGIQFNRRPISKEKQAEYRESRRKRLGLPMYKDLLQDPILNRLWAKIQ